MILTCTVARSSPPCTTSFPDIFHCDTTCSGETVLATRLVLYWYTTSWPGSHSSNAAAVLTTSDISTMTTPACFTEQSGLRGLNLMPGQSMWDFWRIKWKCGRFFSKYLCFSITFIPPVGFVVDKAALWQGYPLSISVFPCQNHSTNKICGGQSVIGTCFLSSSVFPVSFHQLSVFIHSSTNDATQSQRLTALLPNTLLQCTDLLAVGTTAIWLQKPGKDRCQTIKLVMQRSKIYGIFPHANITHWWHETWTLEQGIQLHGRTPN